MNSQQLRERLLRQGLAEPDAIHGCAAEELDEIARVTDSPLPSSYRDFMLHFGKQAGKFLDDVQMFYPAVLGLTADVIEFQDDEDDEDDEEQGPALPECAFVFATRHGEQVLFFGSSAESVGVGADKEGGL